MKGTYLGEFEELILLTVASLGNEAYAVGIREEAIKVSQRNINISAVHSALYRLEEKPSWNQNSAVRRKSEEGRVKDILR